MWNVTRTSTGISLMHQSQAPDFTVALDPIELFLRYDQMHKLRSLLSLGNRVSDEVRVCVLCVCFYVRSCVYSASMCTSLSVILTLIMSCPQFHVNMKQLREVSRDVAKVNQYESGIMYQAMFTRIQSLEQEVKTSHSRIRELEEELQKLKKK
eukprot:GFYU01027330.1.p1 GENE.GFYU01027330.1~~GFYU01027330.1.p1  ORF type:complete len:153 (+),score=8.70 GFYU01027330.1:172-630(+)